MGNETKPVGEEKNRELTLTRTFDAPLKTVWKAWANPKQLERWWGPKGFTNPLCIWEAKPGGNIRVDMKAPGGALAPMDGEFVEVVELKRLVFIAAALDKDGKRLFENLNTVIFSEENGKTKLTMHVTVSKIRPEGKGHLDGMKEGWSQSIDKLAELVNTADREIFAARILNAPRELVWKVWTEPEHIKQWWGPNGFSLTIHKMEVKQNGEWDFIMHGPDGRDYKNLDVFEEIKEPERLVYLHESFPQHRVTVDFEAQGNKTKLTMHMVFPTAELRDETAKTFKAVEGQQQTLNRLEEYLKTNHSK